jgi:GH24 family phage-related lysozyme (muramidase)
MNLSAAGLQLLKKSEGFRDRTYLDVAGLPTIGFGHRLVHPECYPGGITQTQGEVILQWDVREAEQAVDRLVKVPSARGNLMRLWTLPSTSAPADWPVPLCFRI